MNKILGAIREGCSSCKVVIDFSPWFSADNTTWARSAGDFYSGWNRSVVKFVGLTGKPFPFTEGKIDNFTYKEISNELDLPLVVVDAYGFGGGPLNIDSGWFSEGRIVKAVDMGIKMIVLSQQGDVAGYDRFIRQMRAGSSGGPGPGYTQCATEGQVCSFSGTNTVKYGADGHWATKTGVRNRTNCTNAVFGDPIRGVAKKCFVQN